MSTLTSNYAPQLTNGNWEALWASLLPIYCCERRTVTFMGFSVEIAMISPAGFIHQQQSHWLATLHSFRSFVEEVLTRGCIEAWEIHNITYKVHCGEPKRSPIL